MTLPDFLSALIFLHLALSVLHKTVDPDRARTATARLLGPAAHWASFALAAAVAIEAGSALGMLIPGWTAFGMAGAGAIWLIYSGAAGAAWLSGERRFDCGCDLGGRRLPSNLGVVAIRAVALAILALLLAAEAAPVWRDPLALFAALSAMALFFASSQLLFNHRQHGSPAA
ncbi:MauE/DoxX family redox-associated membrane protein [Novosphingobium aquae]|uniref:Methylamine utilization protein MauE n=1 Tax=Novosphingobium aquae TaxID=3133435 RepID=A0ABU8S5X5_9SPHN